jgi:dTDP-4-dehydrorhamnose reductase
MSGPMRVLVAGAAGQVGRAVLASAPRDVEVTAAAHADLDIGDAAQVEAFLADTRPQVIVNAAAYTAVDAAESDVESAARVNAHGAGHLARAAARLGARLIHLSTNFVFDGRASVPYRPGDPTAPLNVYGATKLAGEQAVIAALPQRAVVVRTAWVYAVHGRNFLSTMLQTMQERGEVSVVGDQIGTPTAAFSLASALWRFVERSDLAGVFHWTDAGVASRYDFAVAIAEEASARGLLRRPVTVDEVATDRHSRAAPRPAYCVLDRHATVAALGIVPLHWRVALREAVKELSIA